ncbi:hypothetical protein HZA42_01520 [Candidatus Peregrinibacteria bacterium]|nr:hypothetical protein [Candidatus Peregrinibacteria bacterium]
MIYRQILSKREKILAIIAGALLLLFAVIGYQNAKAEMQANVLAPTFSEVQADAK